MHKKNRRLAGMNWRHTVLLIFCTALYALLTLVVLPGIGE